MSVTTTQNQLYYQTAEHLRDYEIHHSGETGDGEVDTSLNQSPPPAREHQNPASWPTDHRRVPPYRPANPNLDMSERGTRNAAENIFVTIMLNGVRLNAVSAQHPPDHECF